MKRALLLLAVSASAAADPALQVGAGVRFAQQSKSTIYDGHTSLTVPGDDALSPALSIALGYRLHVDVPFGVAIGGRVAVSRMSSHTSRYVSNGSSDTTDSVRYPVDLAATVQLDRGRVWLAPWIGVQSQYRRVTFDNDEPIPDWTTDFAFGASLGVDIIRAANGRFGAVLDAEYAGGYSAVGLGVAYRR